MENKVASICKMCDMQISSKAKKCPYCQHWQNKLSGIIVHPAFVIVPVIIVSVCFLGAIYQTLEMVDRDAQNFSQHANEVSIIDPKMTFGVSSGCNHQSPTVAIIGRIQNDSPVSWEGISLEATFFDKDGNLVDASQQNIRYFRVASKSTSVFKLSSLREFPKEQYVNFKVRIISAKDERNRF